MNVAKRMDLLGSETAFAVSAEAAKLATTGKKIFPFHLGDINLPTPPSVVSAANKAIKDGKTGGPPPPHPGPILAGLELQLE